MHTDSNNDKSGLYTCEQCKGRQKICQPPFERYHKSCAVCMQDGIKCSFLDFGPGPSPIPSRSTSETTKHHPCGGFSRSQTTTAPSSTYSLNSWGQHSPATAPSSCYSDLSEDISKLARHTPYYLNTSTGGGFGSCLEQYQSALPNYNGYRYDPGARGSHYIQVDSGLSSMEQFQPPSPLFSTSTNKSCRGIPKFRVSQRDLGPYMSPLDGQLYHLGASDVGQTAPLSRKYLGEQPLHDTHDLFLKDYDANLTRSFGLKTDIVKMRNREDQDILPVNILEGEREIFRNHFLNFPDNKSKTSFAYAQTLLRSCILQCATVVRRLEDLEKTEKDMIDPMMPLTLSVVNLRLRLWGQITTEPLHGCTEYYSCAGDPLRIISKINGISCELDVVVNTLLNDAQDDSDSPPRMWDKVSELLEELILQVETLYGGLSDIWRETVRWALVANLLVHQSLDEISRGLRARSGGNMGNLFPTSLGPEVPRNLSSMISLLYNRIGIAPMSYDHGLLNPNDLISQGRLYPSVQVYIQCSNNGSPERGLISANAMAYNGAVTPKQAMSSQSVMVLQKRLQLHKPEEYRVLDLAGYLENTTMRQVETLFEVPKWALPPYTPISLTQLYTEGRLPTCMSTRIAIARKLMCALLHFHASDWIHGNIAEHNIIFFTSEAGLNVLEPFLCNLIPNPIRGTSEYDASEAGEGFRETRGFDIYQMALVISRLVLGDGVARQLRALGFPLKAHTTDFGIIFDWSALRLLNNIQVASLFRDAVWNCISGKAVSEGIIEQSEDFSERSGFYWRVVRPLDHCLSLLAKGTNSPDKTYPSMGMCPTNWETLDRYLNQIINPSSPAQGSATTAPKEGPAIQNLMPQKMRSPHSELRYAEKLAVSKLEDMRRVLGENHPEVLILMGYLALSYLNQKRVIEADNLLVDFPGALEISALPSYWLTLTATLAFKLAASYQYFGEHAKAERFKGMVLAAEKITQGRSCPDTCTEHMQECILQSNRRRFASFELELECARRRVRSQSREQQPAEEARVDPDHVPVTYLTSGVAPLFDTNKPENPSQHTLKQISKHPMDPAQDVPITQDSDAIGKEDKGATKVGAGSQGKKRVYPVQAAASTINTWQQTLLPQLEKILERHLPKTESASIDLLGVGTSRESSRPTIVVTCDSVQQVKGHLRKRFVYDQNIFDLKIRKGSVRRSTGRRARENRNSIRRSTGSFHQSCPNRAYQQKPLSGASIGACLDGRPLPPGTYGGLILVDGLPYGATVHHLIDPESEGETDDEDGYGASDEELYEDTPGSTDPENLLQSGAAFSHSDVDSMSIYWDDSDEASDGEELQDISDVEELDTMYCSSTASNIEETDISAENPGGDVGDIPGFPKNHGKDIVITQPAQDDVPDPESFECERGIGAYKLGTVLASSGIRRVNIGAEKHEMDWALVQIEKQRLVARNIIRGGGKYLRRPGPPDLEPCAIVPMAELSELRVHATGRTSGLQGGMISRAMSSVKLHGRETFSKSWHVVGNLGIPGDSGSWVVDNDSGRVCGHVIARCSIKRVSYIVPMELLLEDIKVTLGAKSVRLPSVATEVDQLLDEALAQLEIVDNSSNSRREIDQLLGDEITPLAYKVIVRES